MKIGLRGGHSPYAKGAIGIIDEQSSVRDLSYKVKAVLEAYGHTVIDCNSNAKTVSGELSEGTNKANSNNCDLYITLHMNAFNGSAQGVEALVYNSASTKAVAIGQRACTNLQSLGLVNRGIKYRQDLHDLSASRMQACLIEVLFCDNRNDVDIWKKTSWDTLSYLIGNAIDPNIPKSKPAPPKPNPQPKPDTNTYYRVVCGSFKDKANAEARQKELKDKGFTDTFIDEYKK